MEDMGEEERGEKRLREARLLYMGIYNNYVFIYIYVYKYMYIYLYIWNKKDSDDLTISELEALFLV